MHRPVGTYANRIAVGFAVTLTLLVVPTTAAVADPADAIGDVARAVDVPVAAQAPVTDVSTAREPVTATEEPVASTPPAAAAPQAADRIAKTVSAVTPPPTKSASAAVGEVADGAVDSAGSRAGDVVHRVAGPSTSGAVATAVDRVAGPAASDAVGEVVDRVAGSSDSGSIVAVVGRLAGFSTSGLLGSRAARDAADSLVHVQASPAPSPFAGRGALGFPAAAETVADGTVSPALGVSPSLAALVASGDWRVADAAAGVGLVASIQTSLGRVPLANGDATANKGDAAPVDPPAPTHTSPGSGAFASAGGSSAAAAVALLLLFALAVPKLLLTFKEAPAFLRPVTFVALLERPG